MNFLHLDTYTVKKNKSWPHYNLHKQLLKHGYRSFILSAKGDLEEENVAILNRGNLIPYFGISRFVRKVYFEILRKDAESYFYPEWNLDFISKEQILEKVPFKPDFIITYFTVFAFNQKLIYELSKAYNAPVLCYMVDMAQMTGGCHYAYDCTKYEEKCGRCPAIHSNKENDLSRRTWEYKRKYYDKTDITFLAATSTLMKQAQRSSLIKDKRIERIMACVDEKRFMPGNKEKAKTELGIPGNKKVIFFGAASLKVKRKGVSFLIEALHMLSENIKEDIPKDDIVVLIAGKNNRELEIPYDTKYLGYLNTEEELARAYQACDLFVCPSTEDSGPLMINQAIMSGRPVVSFEMGVAPDLVHTGRTGYRAKLKDSRDLAHGMEMILRLSDKQWDEMSLECRKLALELYSLSGQVNRLEEIIKHLAKD